MEYVFKIAGSPLVDDEHAFAFALLSFLIIGQFAFLYLYMILVS